MSHKGDGLSTVARRTTTREINGKAIELSQLTLKDLVSVREKACDEYKRSVIRTYTENRDLLGDIDLRSKIAEVAAITPDDLPKKKAWVVRTNEDGEVVRSDLDRHFHEPSGAWIDRGDPLLMEKPVPYEAWWASQTGLGRLYSVWLAMRHCPGQEHWTLDDVAAFIRDEAEAEKLANDVGTLTEPRLGKERPAAATN